MTALPDNTPDTYASPTNTAKSDGNAAVDEAKKFDHDWIGSATVDLDDKTAARAARYLSYLAQAGDRIHMLEVYCKKCRRNFDDVKGQKCQAKVNNNAFIGGDQTTRKRRNVALAPESTTPMPGPRINRFGITGILNGEA